MSLRGTVADGENGSGIQGARVTIEGTQTAVMTNANGRFSFATLPSREPSGEPSGELTLLISAPGYLDVRIQQVEAGEELRIELQPSPNVQERLQVTATKVPVSVAEIPAQVDIIDRSTLDRRGDQELTQAVAHVPGLVVSTQAGSFESVTLRGLPRDGNEFTTTLLMIDGVPQTDSRNSARVVNLGIDDASSIEVVRGPSSALYGRTAIGGAINLLTADPTVDHRFELALVAGSFDTLKGHARASGPHSSLGGYYVSGSWEEDEGFYRGPADYQADRNSLFGKLSFAPSPRLFARVSANRVRSDQSTPTNVPIIEGRLVSDIDPRFSPFTNLNLPGPNYHQEEDRYTADLTARVTASSTLSAVLGYREIQYKFIDDGDVIGGPFDLEASSLTMYPFDLQTDEEITYGEVRFEAAPRRAEDALLAGVSYEQVEGFSAGNLIFTDPDTFGIPLDYIDPIVPPRAEWQFFQFGGSDYSLESTGLFGEYRFAPGERWSFVAGARLDEFEIDNTQTFREGRLRIEDSFDELSPRLAVIFAPPSDLDLKLYLSYAEAFLPPRRPSQLRPSDDELALEPEDVENIELGLNGSLSGGELAFDAVLFRGHRDGIVVSTRQGPFFLPSNAGEHDYEGIEAGVRWRASRKISAYTNAALYKNRFGDFVIESSGGTTVLTGNRLPISPDLVVNAGVTVTPHRLFDVELNLKHVGDVAVDQGNTFQLGSYTLLDAAISWRRPLVTLTLSARNLLDEEYFWNGDISRGESADIGPSRQVLFSARFHPFD